MITIDRVNMMARDLMTSHGLRYWVLAFDNAKNRHGMCSQGQISLSRNIVNTPEDEILNTILHEIAHALTIGENHSEIWRALFISIGGNGKRCAATPMAKPKYVGSCSSCAEVFTAHRIGKSRLTGRLYSYRHTPDMGVITYAVNTR